MTDERLPTTPGVYRDRTGDVWLLRQEGRRLSWHLVDAVPLMHESAMVRQWMPFTLDPAFLTDGDSPLDPPRDEEYARVRRLLEGRYFTASEHPDVVALRELVLDLAAEIWTRVPEGRNRAEALLRLEDVQMRANRGLFAEEPHR